MFYDIVFIIYFVSKISLNIYERCAFCEKFLVFSPTLLTEIHTIHIIEIEDMIGVVTEGTKKDTIMWTQMHLKSK